MPLLDPAQIAELLELAYAFSGYGWRMPDCRCRVVKDYCRSCDEFYWIHAPDCRYGTEKHHGHRLTIVPFVEERMPAGQQYIVCPKCGRTSHNPSDILERYCGACHGFHDDLMQGISR